MNKIPDSTNDLQPPSEVFLYATGLQRIVREAVSRHPGLDAARITKALVNDCAGRHDDAFFQVSVAWAIRLNRIQGRIRHASIFLAEPEAIIRQRRIREVVALATQRS